MDPSKGGSVEQQNLTDFQSYLDTFKHEIETAEHTALGDVDISSPGEGDDPSSVMLTVSGTNDPSHEVNSGVSSAGQFSNGFYGDGSLGALSDDAAQQLQSMVGSEGSEEINNSGSSIPSLKDDDDETDHLDAEQISAVQAHIAELTGASISSLIGSAQELSVAGIEGLGDAASGNVIRIVSLSEGMQLVNEETLAQDSDIAAIQAEHIQRQQTETGEGSDDGSGLAQARSESVALLASVAASSASTCAGGTLQTVTVSSSDLHNAQLVALQNSADSSQPQFVALHSADGTESLQVISAEGLQGGQTPLILGNGSSFQTVTIVPSETSAGGEVSYVLIVSQPDGDKEVHKAISLDMLDFKEDGRELTEEVVEEDGTTKRILKITPKQGMHNAQSALMCNYCNYTSPKRYLLSRHMKSHSEERPHRCNICQRGFKTQASLVNHVNTHTGVRPHKCKLCEAAFTTSGELVRHVRYKHTFEKPHRCPDCEYASVELSKLKRHMRSHTGERPYHCPHCSYASPDTYKLKRHLRIHTGEKPYQCEICMARFTQSNSLKAHRLIHSGNKPVFQCDLCPTTCGRKTDLKIHIQKLHTSESPLTCRKCGKGFPDRYTYKLHLKTHEGEKCYKCHHCDYAALSQRHLDSHVLTHSGLKPYSCEQCGQRFRQRQLLRRHRNLHHTPDYQSPSPRSKSHECSSCDRSYANRGNLLRHIGQHEDGCEDLSDCEGDEGESSREGLPTITAQQLLQQGSLIQEWREGKLGKSPQVVIVHPDGRVEEIFSKLQLPPDRGVEDLLYAMEEEAQSGLGADGAPVSTASTSTALAPAETVSKSDAESATELKPEMEAASDGTSRCEMGTQVEIESEEEDEDEEEMAEDGSDAEHEVLRQRRQQQQHRQIQQRRQHQRQQQQQQQLLLQHPQLQQHFLSENGIQLIPISEQMLQEPPKYLRAQIRRYRQPALQQQQEQQGEENASERVAEQASEPEQGHIESQEEEEEGGVHVQLIPAEVGGQGGVGGLLDGGATMVLYPTTESLESVMAMLPMAATSADTPVLQQEPLLAKVKIEPGLEEEEEEVWVQQTFSVTPPSQPRRGRPPKSASAPAPAASIRRQANTEGSSSGRCLRPASKLTKSQKIRDAEESMSPSKKRKTKA